MESITYRLDQFEGPLDLLLTLIHKNKVNIEDISQTLMQGNFTMIMLCDMQNATLSLKDLKDNLVKVGEEIGVSIHVQHEDIFNAMHKI